MAEEEKKTTTKKSSFGKFLYTAAFFIILGGTLAGGLVYSLAKKYPDVLGLSTTITQEEENKKVLAAVSKIMDLPKDEAPSIATVSDIDKSKTENIFKNAKESDKIITYTKSKRLILFRPSENKIIDVGFITTSPSATPNPSPQPLSMNVFIFNGTDTVGATKNIETKILERNKDTNIAGRAVASKTDYTETTLIDLAGNRGEEAKKMAEDLGISVGVLPEGEKKPENTDFLIIVGKNNLPPSATPSPTPTPKAQ